MRNFPYDSFVLFVTVKLCITCLVTEKCDNLHIQDIAFKYQTSKVDWQDGIDLLWQWIERNTRKRATTIINQGSIITYTNCDSEKIGIDTLRNLMILTGGVVTSHKRPFGPSKN